MTDLIVVLDNIRSMHNVGSIMRTCDGLSVSKVIACGLTPYPQTSNDQRLPHVSMRAHSQIAKTALGAESTVEVEHFDDLSQALDELRSRGYELWAIEQSTKSIMLDKIHNLPKKLAITLGSEVDGVDLEQDFDRIVEIPMNGKKESFNVSVTAGIVIYQLCQK